MPPPYRYGRPTIGVLAGWQFYRTATNLSYLAPVYRGISKAAQLLGCNLLLGCGMGQSASPADPFRPAWPIPSPDQDLDNISYLKIVAIFQKFLDQSISADTYYSNKKYPENKVPLSVIAKEIIFAKNVLSAVADG